MTVHVELAYEIASRGGVLIPHREGMTIVGFILGDSMGYDQIVLIPHREGMTLLFIQGILRNRQDTVF